MRTHLTAAVVTVTMTLCLGTSLPLTAADTAPELRITVRDEVLHPVDRRIFGQFMERASWGEPGYDAARDAEAPHRLDEHVVEKMAWMDIPVIRWPAGGDLPRIDWRDMIDNVPGREGGRPPFKGRKGKADLTNAFGLDEFLALCERLGAEPLLPVRFHQAVMHKGSPERWAQSAAALVAYCNAEVGAELPEGMADWPAVRRANGRAAPWDVKYFQVGNETWHYFNQALKRHDLEAADIETKAGLYLRGLRAFLKAMHAIAPEIEIIVDGVTGAGRWVDRAVLTDKVVQEHASYFSLHLYQPWGIRDIQRAGRAVDPGALTAEEVWYNWVSVPAINAQTGQSRLPAWPDWWLARDLGLPIAATEWNWNGWWHLDKDVEPPLKSPWAKGLGAAGMLHAFMRSGNDVRIACQSMLVGQKWGITAIRVDADGEQPPTYMPTGRVTGFYSRHHGNERLLLELAGMPTYAQPVRLNGIAPARRVAVVDVVATRNAETVFLHLINRHLSKAITANFDLRAVGYAGAAVVHRCLKGGLRGTETKLTADTLEPPDRAGLLPVTLPPRSVSIIEVGRAGD